MEGTREEDLAGCQNIQPSSDIIGGLCHLHFSVDVFLCLLEYDLYHIYVEDITAERFLHEFDKRSLVLLDGIEVDHHFFA